MTVGVAWLTSSLRAVAVRRLAAALLPLLLACREWPSQPSRQPNTRPSAPAPTPVTAPVSDIHLADADGTVRARLTQGEWPAWSPDGRRIAFHRGWEIWLIDADGSNEHKLVDGRWPAWSPDGARIAFVADRTISVVNADGSTYRKLLTPKLFLQPFDDIGGLAWSPDGALIAFETLPWDWPSRIVIMSADGSGERPLTSGDGKGDEDGPTWSPDGTRLAYWSAGLGLVTIGRSGDTPNAIDGDGRIVGVLARPAWSPDGRTIAFNSDWTDPSIMTIPASGGAATLLIQNGRHPAWSPDGKRIAFVRVRAE